MQLWADLKSFHKVWTDLLCRKERMHLLYQPELRGWVGEFCAVYHWQFLPDTGSTAGPTYGCRHTSDHMSGLKDRVTTGCQEIQVILHPGDSASHSDTYANKGMELSPLLWQGFLKDAQPYFNSLQKHAALSPFCWANSHWSRAKENVSANIFLRLFTKKSQ